MNKHLIIVIRTWDVLPIAFRLKVYLFCLFYTWLYYVKLCIGLQPMR